VIGFGDASARNISTEFEGLWKSDNLLDLHREMTSDPDDDEESW